MKLDPTTPCPNCNTTLSLDENCGMDFENESPYSAYCVDCGWRSHAESCTHERIEKLAEQGFRKDDGFMDTHVTHWMCE